MIAGGDRLVRSITLRCFYIRVPWRRDKQGFYWDAESSSLLNNNVLFDSESI